MKKWFVSIIVLVVLACGTFWVMADKDMRRLVLNLPTDTNVLFWSTEQRDAVFRAMDRLPFLSKSRVILAGDAPYPLPEGMPLELDTDVDAFMENQRAAALVIVQDGKVRLERYGLDFGPEGRWTSFSVAKSFTSTLVGAALKDGYIRSLEDKVSDYIPDLKGSAYDNVTIQQLLTMTSGVQWNEDYSDPQSDVALFNAHEPDPGVDATVSYMRQLEAEAPPGTKWVYKTGETNLIGVLVSSATGKHLSDYLSEKVWKPFGMEQDASWILGSTGHEISGCCIQASTRDFARLGLFILGGGLIDGEPVLSEGWIEEATSNRVDTTREGYGYGYQWWTLDDGAYMARGIFGQGIFIDPERQLVIASNGNWPQASGRQGGNQDEERLAFYKQVQLAIDREKP
ncbi:beta-lactamase family protein [Marinobacter bryozoorum]|uniref:serine hydrolase domain-containing protein n=1 Tax=Marinobacter bryozoorum TaxID=256324 RepID=UPI002005D874|nr:serine hydrolase [Marinobacter bryozoorum]MCK7546145.1 beta-lactamase family protein [Marinobacter bryozoorum]